MAQQVIRKVSGNRVVLGYIAVMVTLITVLILRECLR